MDSFLTKNRHQVLQASVFLITTGLYSMLHAARTSWAYSKPTLSEEGGFTTQRLSWLDFSFLSAYAIGLYLNGWLGDRVKLKSALFQGFCLTMFALSAFAILDGILNMKSTLLGMLLFAINGLGQSVAFPGFIAVLTNWFPAEQRGLVFGAWMTCCNIGNIIGQQLGKIVIDTLHFEWYYAMIIIAGSLLILTFVMMKFLYITPADAGLTSSYPTAEVSLKDIKIGGTLTDLDAITHPAPETESDTEQLHSKTEEIRAIGFWEAWKLPGVFLYAIVFTCVKASMTAILYWLPTYLKMVLDFQEQTAGLLAAMEVGQLIGVIGIGYVSDRLKNRPLVITSSLLGAVVLFFALSFMKSNEYVLLYTFLLFVGGLFVGGPGGLIVGALSSDLSSGKASGGKKVKATSTITGIIDGSGAIGAAFLQPMIPYMGDHVFTAYTVLLLIATIVTPVASMQASGSKSLFTNKKKIEAPTKSEEMELGTPTTPIDV